MNSDSECLLPPNEPAAFESLCLDLWKEIWHDPGAQKNGRSGQAQAGVDVFGRQDGVWVGVQCKQKDGLLRTKVTVAELEAEVHNALGFQSKLAKWGGTLAERNCDGADYFNWSFYSQGTRERGGASSDTFIAAALEFFGGKEGKQLANSPASPWDKGTQLARYVVRRRALLGAQRFWETCGRACAAVVGRPQHNRRAPESRKAI